MIRGIPDNVRIIYGECCESGELDDRLRKMEARANREARWLPERKSMQRTYHSELNEGKTIVFVWWWLP